ncbi:hypothetical protein BC937DRAFT_93893 [Endogone sp. FLAS-F59071]|nr:hypothetical protein BC937DRAFT_93893 [Endogone sp. FLAS-F59071]|eukprot:RUS20987.1 hypothetical protein BC937DRAFT_93893 [Endogone sp. FLAS-F59071]
MSKLMKHINEVKVTLTPFNPNAKSSRLFLSRILTDEVKIDNPALKVSTSVMSDFNAIPSIHVTYRDGKKLDIHPGDMKVNDVLTLVNKHAKKLQEEQDANA